MDSIADYLMKTGISRENIIIDYTEEHPQSVLLSVNSKSKKSLELLYNIKSALTLQVDLGKYEKGDHPLIDTLAWKPGLYEVNKDGRYYLIRINRLVPPEVMSFNEARGKAISLYQEELEKNWIKALKNKYIVEVDHKVLKKVYRDLEHPVDSHH
jgi:peptidyl-prolyl cis-trans isomerase SurA